MPELPDIALYISALTQRLAGHRLQGVRLASLFLLRSVSPPLDAAAGKQLIAFERLGKRIVFCLEDELFLVLHLMIAGRLRWKSAGAKIPAKLGQAAFDFDCGTLLLTEAGSKRRAALHVVQGRHALAAHDPGGLEPLEIGLAAFRSVLADCRHTLKRTLTDPTIFSGIGNAYSDEILHRAQLSPFKIAARLEPEEVKRLHRAMRQTLTEWVERLREEAGSEFPEKVTAFREEMAVHGRYRLPCPDCGKSVQRIVYAGNEANYCADCQTGGRLLADRALSRLLRQDWPRTVEALENRLKGDKE